MSLNTGTRLGSYEVIALLGVGGMGEVYRAHDTNLKRQVAIKVLPGSLSGDAERLARFQREAEILAALNHQNIAHVHGLEKSDGTVALVMELVEGPTLADRIARGPIPLQQALAIAKQIAEALEAAHDQGIVHRDLKPANIKVRDDGKVKVLDFGLAKAMDPLGSRPDVSQSPTITSPALTRAGVVLGTAAYMSPEQARGLPVDKRTDIWSFGCVLHEMLTGTAPFARHTASDSIAAILERDPDWTALPAGTPQALRRLVARCLVKDRAHRLHDMGDVRLELDEALAVPAALPPVPTTSGSRSVPWWWIAALAAVAATAAFVTWTVTRHSSAQQSTFSARFAITAPPGYEIDLNRSPVGISPDGRTIAFVAARGSSQQIYLRDLDQLDATPLTGTEGGFSPFFSPDGKWIGFFANQKIRKILRTGGVAIPIADIAENPGNRSVSATWPTQDTILFTPDVTKGIWRVSAEGGTPQPVTAPTGTETFHVWPQQLPGNKAILFSAIDDGPDPNVFVQRLDNGERRPLIRGLGTRYIPSGQLLFARGGSLMAVSFDLARLEITGSPVPVVPDIREPLRLRTTATGFNPVFDVSASGTLAFFSADRAPRHALVWVDRAGHEQPIGAAGGTYAQPRLSPDGRRIALVIRGDDHDDVWLYDLARAAWDRVTSEGNNTFPVWTLNGTTLTYNTDRTGAISIESKRLDGSAPQTVVPRAWATRLFPFSWSPDGALAFVALKPDQNIWMMRPGADATPTPLVMTPAVEGAPMVSPDGRAVAYVSNETGRNEIYVRLFAGPGEKLTITNSGANEPVWSPKGHELFYRNGNAMMAVDVETNPALKAGTPRRLFEGRYETTLALYANYSVTPDGQRFVMVKRIDEPQTPAQINVFINWFDELTRTIASK